MPWTMGSARQHTKAAKSPKQQRQWAHVANNMLQSGSSEASAIKAAKAVVKRGKTGKRGKQGKRTQVKTSQSE